jgi:hypothetical protein
MDKQSWPARVVVVGALAVLGAAGARAQETAPPAPAAPAPAAPIEKTVEQTASPELVGQLASELAISPRQAESGAGALFGVAKKRLAPADFAKLAAAVPNIGGLLAAAPAVAGGAVDPLAGAAGSLGGVAGATAALSKLGLKPETVARFAPALIKAVQSKGGAEIGALLAGALK